MTGGDNTRSATAQQAGSSAAVPRLADHSRFGRRPSASSSAPARQMDAVAAVRQPWAAKTGVRPARIGINSEKQEFGGDRAEIDRAVRPAAPAAPRHRAWRAGHRVAVAGFALQRQVRNRIALRPTRFPSVRASPRKSARPSPMTRPDTCRPSHLAGRDRSSPRAAADRAAPQAWQCSARVAASAPELHMPPGFRNVVHGPARSSEWVDVVAINCQSLSCRDLQRTAAGSGKRKCPGRKAHHLLRIESACRRPHIGGKARARPGDRPAPS